VCVYIIFFFFSSRRRHTRFDCDWSSDVCSSDLLVGEPERYDIADEAIETEPVLPRRRSLPWEGGEDEERPYREIRRPRGRRVPRSEERRVGKEGRSRRARDG